MWSTVEKTALAEAELEYREHKSITIFVKFPIKKSSDDDVLGANNFNIDVLFIRSGIHKKEIQTLNDLEKTAKNYLSKLPQELLTSEYL